MQNKIIIDMQEERLDIDIENGKLTRGYFSKPEAESSAIIIFVHGFLGKANDHIFFNGAKYFADKGFATYRFDFYHHKSDCRDMSESSFKMHIEDLNRVIEYFEGKYKKVILVAHSLGALITLFSDNAKRLKVILWDPALGISNYLQEKCDWYNENVAVFNLGFDVLLPKRYIESLMGVCNKGVFENIHKFAQKPGFVFAGGYRLKELWSREFKDIKDFEVYEIPRSNHNFDTHKWESELFDITLKLFG